MKTVTMQAVLRMYRRFWFGTREIVQGVETNQLTNVFPAHLLDWDALGCDLLAVAFEPLGQSYPAIFQKQPGIVVNEVDVWVCQNYKHISPMSSTELLAFAMFCSESLNGSFQPLPMDMSDVWAIYQSNYPAIARHVEPLMAECDLTIYPILLDEPDFDMPDDLVVVSRSGVKRFYHPLNDGSFGDYDCGRVTAEDIIAFARS